MNEKEQKAKMEASFDLSLKVTDTLVYSEEAYRTAIEQIAKTRLAIDRLAKATGVSINIAAFFLMQELIPDEAEKQIREAIVKGQI